MITTRKQQQLKDRRLYNLGGHHSISREGGGVGFFVAGKLIILTGLGGALKISHFITCLYRTLLEVNYLFHADSARKYFFQKNSSPSPLPPPSELNGAPLDYSVISSLTFKHPAHTSYVPKINCLLGHSLRCWPDIKTTLFAG